MPPIEAIGLAGLLGIGLAILGAGLYVATTGLDRMRTARRLREAGPIPIADVPGASGLVEFAGTVRASDGESLEAPLSGESCLAYTVESRSREPGAGSNAGDGEADEWRIDGGAAASVPFLVDDGADSVRVDPANAVLSLDWETAETGWTDETDLSAQRRRRLATAGLPGLEDGDDSPDGDETGSSRRDANPDRDEATARQYRERRLEAGADVRVFGGSVTDASARDGADGPVTVAGDDWFEISTGETTGSGATVLSDRRRSGSMYLIFGGLLAVPGIGFTLAGIVGLISTLVL